jgi:hypothetical protein
MESLKSTVKQFKPSVNENGKLNKITIEEPQPTQSQEAFMDLMQTQVDTSKDIKTLL